jgi:hypothetical protein
MTRVTRQRMMPLLRLFAPMIHCPSFLFGTRIGLIYDLAEQEQATRGGRHRLPRIRLPTDAESAVGQDRLTISTNSSMGLASRVSPGTVPRMAVFTTTGQATLLSGKS